MKPAAKRDSTHSSSLLFCRKLGITSRTKQFWCVGYFMRKNLLVNFFVIAFFSIMLSAADADPDNSTNEAASTLSESEESILDEVTIKKFEACGVTLDELTNIFPLEGLHTILDLRTLSIARYVAHGAALFVGVPLTLSLGKICSAAPGVGCSVASGILFTISIGGIAIPCVYGILSLRNILASKHNKYIKDQALCDFLDYRDHETLATDDDIKYIGTALYKHPELLKKLSPAQTRALAQLEAAPKEVMVLEQSENEVKKLQGLLIPHLDEIEKQYSNNNPNISGKSSSE
jgi:hypothetical protein